MPVTDPHHKNKGRRLKGRRLKEGKITNGRDKKGACDKQRETGQMFVSFRESLIRATRKMGNRKYL